jgi:transposase
MNDAYPERIVAMRRYLQGETPGSIYTSLGRSEGWFFNWKRRYDAKGLEGLHDYQRPLSTTPSKGLRPLQR